MNDLIRRNDPFDIFQRFGDLLDRDSFFAPAQRGEWLPPVDIQETDGGYTFRMDVPGLKPEDLEVELHEGILSIRGSRNEEKREEDKGYVRVERRQGSFARQFRVPTSVRAENLSAKVAEGVLTIEVPKGEGPEARKVPVS
jgi:HSP20 family protein